MIAEERLQDAMAACRAAIAPSFDRLDERATRRREHRRRVRTAMAAAAAVAVLTSAVAIAAHQRSTSGAEDRLKQQFVAQANRICDQAIRQVEALRPKPPAGNDEIVRALAAEAAADEAAIAALHALGAPPSDRVTVATMLGHFDEAMGASLVIVAVGNATQDTRSAAYTTAQGTASEQIGRATKAALDYGVARCAELIYPPYFW